MLRATGAVVLGYIVMFVLVFCLLTGLWLVLGADGALRPGFYRISSAWLAAMVIVSIIAAVAGGWVCAATAARGSKAPRVLAGLVIVLGLLLAIPALTGERAEPRTRSGEVSMFEAMANVEEPAWISLANPFIGAIGTLIGARLKR
jgi:hypothetical protein